MDTNTLRQFLGLTNYARKYLPNLSKIASPLYAKLTLKGEKRFNEEDIKSVRMIKELVRNIKPLQLPLEKDYLVIETDGSAEGWGAILKCKPSKYDDRKTEQICRYGSGKYQEKVKSSLASEALAILYALESFRLYILSKMEITVRTDCEAIVKYHNKLHDKKDISSLFWIKFRDTLLMDGIPKINFEKIKGKENDLPDILSRLIYGEPVKQSKDPTIESLAKVRRKK